jgi:hypothetical protein
MKLFSHIDNTFSAANAKVCKIFVNLNASSDFVNTSPIAVIWPAVRDQVVFHFLFGPVINISRLSTIPRSPNALRL